MDKQTKILSAENPQLCKVLSFKPGVGQNISLHASPTIRKCAQCIQLHFFPIFSKHEVMYVVNGESAFHSYSFNELNLSFDDARF